MTAAIIKFDSLTNAVWSTTKDDNLVFVAWPSFAFHIAHHWAFICGIHIGRLRFEFGSTGINTFKDRCDTECLARPSDCGLFCVGEFGKARIGEPEHLERTHPFSI